MRFGSAGLVVKSIQADSNAHIQEYTQIVIETDSNTNRQDYKPSSSPVKLTIPKTDRDLCITYNISDRCRGRHYIFMKNSPVKI